ncbi:MAG: LysM peptidoglycan-binding domain-containing protein [Nannocystaceae bacterium]
MFAQLWKGHETVELRRAKWVIHTVTPRERLTQIAVRYAVKTKQILDWNELETPTLETRQKLRIKTRRIPPPRRRLLHISRAEETWGSIAAMYRVSTRDLHAYNWKVRRLQPGTTLVIWMDPGRAWTVFRFSPSHATPHPISVPMGGTSVGRPNRGRLVDGVQIPKSTLYERREPRILWGSSYAVRHLVDSIARFRAVSGYDGAIILKSMSREHGRRFPPHRSHQSGRDIDIQLPLLPGARNTAVPEPDEVDWEATWALVAALEASHAIDLIFLDISVQRRLYEAARGLGATHDGLRPMMQWPREPNKAPALVRHGKGHLHHIHVRFGCAQAETRCRSKSRYRSATKRSKSPSG